jgi:magnesium chelatase family protein
MNRIGSRNWITAICGELALTRRSSPERATLAAAIKARRRRRGRLIVPHQNAAEAAVVDGLSVFGATSLSEVVQFLRGERELAAIPTQPWTAQYHVRRAVEVAAAGGHNLFMMGPTSPICPNPTMVGLPIRKTDERSSLSTSSIALRQ